MPWCRVPAIQRLSSEAARWTPGRYSWAGSTEEISTRYSWVKPCSPTGRRLRAPSVRMCEPGAMTWWAKSTSWSEFLAVARARRMRPSRWAPGVSTATMIGTLVCCMDTARLVRPDRELLSGVVELDETMVGGRTKRAVSMQQTKVPIMVAVETPGAHRLGRIRLARATAKNSDQLVDFAHQVIAPGSHIRTDGARNLRQLGE